MILNPFTGQLLSPRVLARATELAALTPKRRRGRDVLTMADAPRILERVHEVLARSKDVRAARRHASTADAMADTLADAVMRALARHRNGGR